MKFNPQVVQWLPLGLVLAFFLTFFPWAGKANAWDFAFGLKVQDIVLVKANVLMIFFVLLTIFAAMLAVASVLFVLKVIPDVPALKPFLPMRSLIVGGVGGLAWLCFTLHLIIWLFSEGVIPLNFVGILAWWIYTIAVAGAFIEFWLEKRGPGKPVPRMSMEW